MADEPMTDEQLQQIRARVGDQVATQVEAEYLLAEVDRLRAREAAAMAIVAAMVNLGDDSFDADDDGMWVAHADIAPLVEQARALLASPPSGE